MANQDWDAIVIGAGAAGLTVLRELTRAGLKVLCVEARDRIGGRVMTVHDPAYAVPVELGAEFVHGRSPQIWDEISSAPLTALRCEETMVRVDSHAGEVEPDVDGLMNAMRAAAASEPDRSFQDFLNSAPYAEDAKQWAGSYVEGFNAARKEIIGIASLAQDAAAADEIDGDQSFRIVNGYDSLMWRIFSGVKGGLKTLRLNCVVKEVEWTRCRATVYVRQELTGVDSRLHAGRVVVTVPLGVLHAGAVCFSPSPERVLAAARALAFGQVFRTVLRFRESFWQQDDRFAQAGFILSQESVFPTWWTMLPLETPVITGWSSGPKADALVGKSKPELLGAALESLARITDAKLHRVRVLLESAHIHDWQADPFARGAYSYVPEGAIGARKALAEPVESTLFFAGEATEFNGHSATVHGAMESGYRAARQVLQSF